jgi:hypothetical protein
MKQNEALEGRAVHSPGIPEWSRLVAAATTAAAATATGEGARFCGAAVGGAVGRAEDGELDGVFLAGTAGAGDFLSFVEDDFFEVSLAVVANVFVDGHAALR